MRAMMDHTMMETHAPSLLPPGENNAVSNSVCTHEERKTDVLSNVSLRIQSEKISPRLAAEVEKYADYPLLQSMVAGEAIRANKLVADGYKQMAYPQSNDGWLRTLLVVESRGLRNILLPWCLCVLNATIWTLCGETLGDAGYKDADVDSWSFFIGIILNASLAFLLVFRLNRAAERFWLARESWGFVVSCERQLVDGILVHGMHEPTCRDDAIRWALAFAIASMQYIRNEPISSDLLAGVLEPWDVQRLEASDHPPLFACGNLRAMLKRIFPVTSETPAGLAVAWSQQMSLLESTLNQMIGQQGTMERIRGTPLPIVYVSHLRTFLLLFLLVLPYVWQTEFGWATIPVMAVTSFALLGIEGAAQEVESPFRRDCPNHLNMDGFCLLLFKTTQQLLKNSADRDIEDRRLGELEGTEA